MYIYYIYIIYIYILYIHNIYIYIYIDIYIYYVTFQIQIKRDNLIVFGSLGESICIRLFYRKDRYKFAAKKRYKKLPNKSNLVRIF